MDVVNMCIRMALNIWDIGKKMSRMEMGKKHCQMVLIMKENIRMGKNLAKENFNLLMDLYMLVNSIQIIFMAKEFINERTTESMQENVPMTNFINNQIYISENQIDNLYKKKYQHGCQQRENQFNSNRND
ncbi:unnamed protein product [Paramecium octaurelia]|uniref:Uncharacterized protein n=1 Tax=Paramecium octaurelia TaxID=43137 RepID=A0A8S1T3Z8_PAROT|nr:unnamed protein product [Paramecium octaurelia]